MDFKAFDTQEIDAYTQKAKQLWGHTDAYKEYEQKSKTRSREDETALGQEFMDLFKTFGDMKDKDPNASDVQQQVANLRQYITNHFYTCTNAILASLGEMYAAGGSMTENIDRAGGEGTAAFTAEAIRLFCAGQ